MADQVQIVLKSTIFKVDEMKRIVFGKVLVPDKEDSQGDIITKEDIEFTAHGFMMTIQQPHEDDEAGIGHQHQIVGGIGLVVESYINDEGSWIMGTKVIDDTVWDKILKGEITGYSVGGVGVRVPLEDN